MEGSFGVLVTAYDYDRGILWDQRVVMQGLVGSLGVWSCFHGYGAVGSLLDGPIADYKFSFFVFNAIYCCPT